MEKDNNEESELSPEDEVMEQSPSFDFRTYTSQIISDIGFPKKSAERSLINAVLLRLYNENRITLGNLISNNRVGK